MREGAAAARAALRGAQAALVSGSVGLVVARGSRPRTVLLFTIVDDKILAIS